MIKSRVQRSNLVSKPSPDLKNFFSPNIVKKRSTDEIKPCTVVARKVSNLDEDYFENPATSPYFATSPTFSKVGFG